ncbi:MAG TPA: hypothetical protein PK496_06850 [Bacteroidales bacterium]|nr:hypothetical protein [Bacteroidales bacterium]
MNTKMNPGKKNLDEIISGIKGFEILDVRTLSHIRGGDGEEGLEPIIIPPKRP